MVEEIKYKDLDTCRKCCYLLRNNICRHHQDKEPFVYLEIEEPGLYVCGNYEKEDA